MHDLGTKDLNEIKNILVYEVLNTSGFLEPIKNEYKGYEIMNELNNQADEIGKKYLLKKEQEEKKLQEIKEKNQPPPPPPPQINYFQATPYTGVSIVDGLKAIGECRTYDYRAIIAARNGINGYTGTPQQNTHMLNLLKQGKLIKP